MRTAALIGNGSKWLDKRRGRVVTVLSGDPICVSYEAPHPNRPGYTITCHTHRSSFLRRFVPVLDTAPGQFRIEMGSFFKGQGKPDSIAYLKKGEDVVALFGASFLTEAEMCRDMLNGVTSRPKA